MDILRTLILATAGACASSTCAANDIIALEVPGIPGDATFSATYGLPPGSIEVFSVSGGFAQALNIGSQSSGSGAGKITFNPISISKHFGASSPAILLSIAQGTFYDQGSGPVLISFYHLNRNGPASKYFSIKLSTAAIQSVDLSDSETRPHVNDLESVGFDYGIITITDLATGNSVCWNRIANRRC